MFLALAALVGVAGDDPPAFDEVVFRLSERLQHEGLNSFMREIGRLGGTEVVIPIGVTFAALVALKRRSLSPLAIVLMSYGFAAWFTLRFKHLLERPEPFDGPTDLGLSYPSGHLSQSVSVYLVLFALAEAFRWRAAIRAVIALMLAIVVTAVIYRSAHWTIDAIGGAALGVGAACIAILAMRGLERLPVARGLLAALHSRPVTQPRPGSAEPDGGGAHGQRDRDRARR